MNIYIRAYNETIYLELVSYSEPIEAYPLLSFRLANCPDRFVNHSNAAQTHKPMAWFVDVQFESMLPQRSWHCYIQYMPTTHVSFIFKSIILPWVHIRWVHVGRRSSSILTETHATKSRIPHHASSIFATTNDDARQHHQQHGHHDDQTTHGRCRRQFHHYYIGDLVSECDNFHKQLRADFWSLLIEGLIATWTGEFISSYVNWRILSECLTVIKMS